MLDSVNDLHRVIDNKLRKNYLYCGYHLGSRAPFVTKDMVFVEKKKSAKVDFFRLLVYSELWTSFHNSTLHFLCGSYHVAIWVNLKVVPFGKNVESLPIFDNEDIISNRQGLVGNMGLRGEQGKEGAPVGSLKKFEKPQLKCSYSAHCYT